MSRAFLPSNGEGRIAVKPTAYCGTNVFLQRCSVNVQDGEKLTAIWPLTRSKTALVDGTVQSIREVAGAR